MLDADIYAELLHELQDRFLAVLLRSDPARPVPSCGDWTVADLADHLAGVHHWAAGMARGERSRPREKSNDLGADYRAQAAQVRDTLTDLGPDAVGRILDGLSPDGRGPALFWYRRQVHETLIHLHDLTAATGADGAEASVAPAVWADAVDEVVEVMYPRQLALGRAQPLDVDLVLTASDADRTWRLGDADARAGARAHVRGSARELALLLWRRARPGSAGITVDGDPAVLATALAGPIVP